MEKVVTSGTGEAMRISMIVALVAGLALSPAAEAAVAIALNTSNGRAAANNASFDLEAVKRNALSACGSGCRIVAARKRTCAAVVEAISTGTRAWAVAYGTTTGAAISAATHECRRKGGVSCRAAASICD